MARVTPLCNSTRVGKSKWKAKSKVAYDDISRAPSRAAAVLICRVSGYAAGSLRDAGLVRGLRHLYGVHIITSKGDYDALHDAEAVAQLLGLFLRIGNVAGQLVKLVANDLTECGYAFGRQFVTAEQA